MRKRAASVAFPSDPLGRAPPAAGSIERSLLSVFGRDLLVPVVRTSNGTVVAYLRRFAGVTAQKLRLVLDAVDGVVDAELLGERRDYVGLRLFFSRENEAYKKYAYESQLRRPQFPDARGGSFDVVANATCRAIDVAKSTPQAPQSTEFAIRSASASGVVLIYDTASNMLTSLVVEPRPDGLALVAKIASFVRDAA